MNRIFKVIWSKTKHMKIVVSEIAHNLGKCKYTTAKVVLSAFTLAFSYLPSAFAIDSLTMTQVSQIYKTGTLIGFYSSSFYTESAQGDDGHPGYNTSYDRAVYSFLDTDGKYKIASIINNGSLSRYLDKSVPLSSFDTKRSDYRDADFSHAVNDYFSDLDVATYCRTGVLPSGAYLGSSRPISGDVLYTLNSDQVNQFKQSGLISNVTSDGSIEYDTDVKAKKTLTVDGTTTLKNTSATNLTTDSSTTKKQTVNGDSTVTGNESVIGKSTVGSQEVTGNAEIKGNQTVDGTTTLNDKTTITKGGLDVTGGTTTDSLTVTGDSNFTGNTTVNGSSEVKGDSTIGGNEHVKGTFTADGATTLNNTLEVKGKATFDSDTETKGSATIDKDLTVKGTTNVNDLNVSGKFSVTGDTVLKNTKVDGTFESTGNATFDGDTETKGNAKFDKNVDVDGNITAKGDISGANGSFTGDLNVTGKTTTGSLEVSGDSTIGGNEHVKGTFTADGATTLNDTLEVKGKATFDSDTETKGSSTIGKNLTVNGTTDLKGDVTAESNMTVNKDFTVKGTASLQNTNVAGNLDVQGDTTLKNTKVDGTFVTTGKAIFDGDTETKGSAAIGKNLTVSGTTDLKGDLLAEGNAIMNQDMTVKGSASIGRDFMVAGNTTLSGDTRIEKSLTVTGPATFSNDVHMDKNLSVDGNISTSGVITASDAIIGGKSINSTLENLGSAMDSKIDSVSHRLNQNINKAAAGAAALAALHPQDFDPDDKWDFAAGMGHYHDANSAALGVYYHPNEDTLVSLGSTMGNGDPMMNLGVSVKLGHGSGKTLSRAEMSKMLKTDREAMKVMVKNMIEMKKEIEALKANKVDSLKVSEISDKKTFPDVPTTHWANQAVTTLHDNHVVQGYPDGNFKGDRTMTRYEYANMLYNALKRGLPVPQKQIDEYETELKKIAESRNESLPVSKAVKNSNKKAAVKAVKVEPAKSSVSVKK